jgi:hypothetical protein
MNRRKMLTLSAGFALVGINPTILKAQESPLWFIHEGEFNTSIVLPNNKKTHKGIITNRFDESLSRYENIIKKAEALYPYYTIGNEMGNGKPFWFSDRERKTPYNVTPGAVNFYFNLAVNNKNSRTKYQVEVNELIAVTKENRNRSEPPEEVYEVSLFLNYGLYCGKLCGGGFDRRKKVIFNHKGEIAALYMPNLIEWVS